MKNKNFKIDFLGVGTIRGGTTWVHECLKEHPQVCVPTPKETHFFNDSYKYQKGLTYYSSFFKSKKCKVRGEINPGYLNNPMIAEKIKKNFPNIKILIFLRNPIERAWSHFLKHKNKGCNQIEKFEEILKKENIYINTGFYYKNIKKYIELFGKEKVLILIYEDLEKNPEKFIESIYSFIGVDKTFKPKVLSRKVNYLGYSNAYLPKLNKILIRPSKLLPKKLLKLLKKSRLIEKIFLNIRKIMFRLNTSKNHPYNKKTEEIPSKLRKEMKEIYKEDIQNIEKLMKRNLNFWK
ncbi:hypothetical protein A2442_00560 [Candidatus Campbellbacteria bacterium RIFOXYC2_FULL_35_25]|uniref:Sulfotransferase domain-containing protein n=1 Tax=Candidatus Campbellbacteria bacterium RIFOXYC2_FULL_35_25 TaxID=1797582 RepID=A0A1F5EIU1_9BACT|nr:MAG: hypothetical protein A2442_00560 [Candidatus Campbellbacteria bacterium RIFOXYC2_FULL_35_25]